MAKQISMHLKKAIQGLSKPGSFDVAVAANAYIYLSIERKHGATASSAEEVLSKGTGVCGGMTLALRGLLNEAGIENEYAFTVGGLVAHSMVQAKLDNGQNLLMDPYHGVLYFSEKDKLPLGIDEVYGYLKSPEVVYFVDRKSKLGTKPLKFKTAYTSTLDPKPVDYDFPELFSTADSFGVANSGFTTLVGMELKPDAVIGNPKWVPGNDYEPRPWTSLSRWKKEDTRYLSWAYLLGISSQGYLIEHTYMLKGLTPGNRYRLELLIATAHPVSIDRSTHDCPAITIQPITPFGKPKKIKLEARAFSDRNDYHPQIAKMSIIASHADMTLQTFTQAEIVIQSIQLKAL